MKKSAEKPAAEWREAIDNSLAARALRGERLLAVREQALVFSLSKEEHAAARAFAEKHRTPKGRSHPLSPKTRRRTVHLEYRFRQCPEGVVVIVHCLDCDAEKDVTDYGAW